MNFDFPFLDLVGGTIGALLTLLVFSYLFGDHVIVRLVFYGYVGLMGGFAVVIAYNSVIYPSLVQPIFADPVGGLVQVAVPFLLSGLLVFKLSNRFSVVGNLSVAFLVGVGLAALIGGAIHGTLIPQIWATIRPFELLHSNFSVENRLSSLVQATLILLGTVTTLAYFHFGARPRPSGSPRRLEWIETLSWVGQFFIAIALGLIFAGLLKAGFVALIERVRGLIDWVTLLQRGF